MWRFANVNKHYDGYSHNTSYVCVSTQCKVYRGDTLSEQNNLTHVLTESNNYVIDMSPLRSIGGSSGYRYKYYISYIAYNHIGYFI